MKKLTNITVVSLAIVAFLFAFLIARMVPEHQFAPYKLNLDSFWKKENATQEYRVDINDDQVLEIVRHHNINEIGHSIELKQGSKENQIYIFKENELFVGQELVFADIDGDAIKELLFISVKSNVASLNILSYDQASRNLLPLKKIAIDSVKQQSEHPDVCNTFMIVSETCVYFNLQAGFAIQPRNIYKYNSDEESLIKTRLNSLVTPQADFFYYQGKPFLLASHVKATGNTICPREADELSSSTNTDTLEIFKTLEHLVYSYGDFSSYILLYNDNLEFEFEPIEFFGWANFTKSALVTVDSVPYIVSFTNAPRDEPDNQRSKTISLCTLEGKVVKQVPLSHNYSDVYTNQDQIVFFGDQTLYLQDHNLAVPKEISEITHSCGFVDINQDDCSEFVAFRNNVLTIFSEDFDINATLSVEQEFAPYPEYHITTLFSDDGKCQLMYHTRLFYYLFTYEKNSIAILKYPFYVMVFLLLFGGLFLIYHLSVKRLENENFKLESKVQERTQEIVKQKTEIEKQAEELRATHLKLLELDKFKQGLSSMIVHDLKNPLNAILNVSTSVSLKQQVTQMKQMGNQMLNLVLNILDVNKYEESRIVVDKTIFSLLEVAEIAIDDIRFLSEQKHITIHNNIALDFAVNADKSLVVRVLVNLMTNAVKYTPNNGVIYLEAMAGENGYVKVLVRDTGEGIPKEKQHLVFEKFAQADARASGRVRSTGLGLTFCKMVVEAHGGSIAVSSEVHHGATFAFTLKAAQGNVSGHSIPNKEEKQVLLSAADRQQLLPLVKQLQELEVYKMFEIRKHLNCLDDNGSLAIVQWKQDVFHAVGSGNKLRYKELIRL